jgi:hypothetical protein
LRLKLENDFAVGGTGMALDGIPTTLRWLYRTAGRFFAAGTRAGLIMQG